MLQERLVVSGLPGVQALRQVSLSIVTVDGPAELAPVVSSVGNSRQRVTFDGKDPARFARRRSRAIGPRATVVRDAGRGKAPAPAPSGAAVSSVGEPSMAAVLRAASRRIRTRR